ncbi:hypothetical protein RUM43_011166 [Polyplax serrata]|uniref:SAM domain-containing protein n=1 Tax=Polyplax serrata TaxID=468196 RepID=A0AAN8RTE6_POLSC
MGDVGDVPLTAPGERRGPCRPCPNKGEINQVGHKVNGKAGKIEAAEACKWLRAAGFPQYAQMFEVLEPVSSVRKSAETQQKKKKRKSMNLACPHVWGYNGGFGNVKCRLGAPGPEPQNLVFNRNEIRERPGPCSNPGPSIQIRLCVVSL